MSDLTVRRVITGHDGAGKCVFVADEPVAAERMTVPLAEGDKTLDHVSVWTTATVPANNSDALPSPDELGPQEAHDLAQGILFRICELPPNSSSPMHRTHTVDYGILLEGECDLMLDGGDVVHLKPGDVAIQRGTSHSWINRGNVPCRWAWILIGADPISVDGRPLPSESRAAPAIAGISETSD